VKLTYWVATQHRDSQCYNLRAKTKKEILSWFESGVYEASDYDPPKKVVFEYADAFPRDRDQAPQGPHCRVREGDNFGEEGDNFGEEGDNYGMERRGKKI
jgi:hypothetical protein